VLDEPTNDLEIETLDLLEDLLLEFSGTLMVVSHDRTFLDNVVTSTLVLEGGGVVGEYVGGYTDWVRQRKQPSTATEPARATRRGTPSPAPIKTKKRRLSFKETSELAGLPDQIDALEREREVIYASLGESAVLRDGSAVVAAKSRLVALDNEIAALIQRWEELETIAGA